MKLLLNCLLVGWLAGVAVIWFDWAKTLFYDKWQIIMIQQIQKKIIVAVAVTTDGKKFNSQANEYR